MPFAVLCGARGCMLPSCAVRELINIHEGGLGGRGGAGARLGVTALSTHCLLQQLRYNSGHAPPPPCTCTHTGQWKIIISNRFEIQEI